MIYAGLQVLRREDGEQQQARAAQQVGEALKPPEPGHGQMMGSTRVIGCRRVVGACRRASGAPSRPGHLLVSGPAEKSRPAMEVAVAAAFKQPQPTVSHWRLVPTSLFFTAFYTYVSIRLCLGEMFAPDSRAFKVSSGGNIALVTLFLWSYVTAAVTSPGLMPAAPVRVRATCVCIWGRLAQKVSRSRKV